MSKQMLVTGSRGVAIVEAAMILPIFLFLLFGIMEAGRIMLIYNTATNAAREGARKAVEPRAGSNQLRSDSEIQQIVCRWMQTATEPCTSADVSVSTVTEPLAGGAIIYRRVEVLARYTPLALGFAAMTLKGTSQMRSETSEF